MKYSLLLIFSLLLHRHGGVNDIYKKNQLRNKAEKAFHSKNYKLSIKNYTLLLDSLKTEDPSARLNLSHSYLLSHDSTSALQNYQKCLISDDPSIRSIALQQMGMIQYGMKSYKEALQTTKEALKSNPENEEARYNYELIKKTIKEQQEKDKDKKDQNKDKDKKDKEDKKDEQKQDQQKKNEDQQKQDQQKKDEQDQKNDQKKEQQNQEDKKDGKDKKDKDKNGEESKKDEKEKEKEKQDQMKEGKDDKEKQKEKEQAMQQQEMKPISISPEMAKMILEAMKNSERQFLQQLQKKSTKAKDKRGKDW